MADREADSNSDPFMGLSEFWECLDAKQKRSILTVHREQLLEETSCETCRELLLCAIEALDPECQDDDCPMNAPQQRNSSMLYGMQPPEMQDHHHHHHHHGGEVGELLRAPLPPSEEGGAAAAAAAAAAGGYFASSLQRPLPDPPRRGDAHREPLATLLGALTGRLPPAAAAGGRSAAASSSSPPLRPAGYAVFAALRACGAFELRPPGPGDQAWGLLSEDDDGGEEGGEGGCRYCRDKFRVRFVDMLTYPRPIRKFKLLLDRRLPLGALRELMAAEVGLSPGPGRPALPLPLREGGGEGGGDGGGGGDGDGGGGDGGGQGMHSQIQN